MQTSGITRRTTVDSTLAPEGGMRVGVQALGYAAGVLAYRARRWARIAGIAAAFGAAVLLLVAVSTAASARQVSDDRAPAREVVHDDLSPLTGEAVFSHVRW